MKGCDSLKNEKLLALCMKLIQARSAIDSADMKIRISQEEMNKVKNGYDAYSHNRGDVVFSFLSMHKTKYEEAKKRYEIALLEKVKVVKNLDSICKDIKRYALNCIPPQYRKAAVIEYEPFSNFVTISYFVDEEAEKEHVNLRLYINEQEF